MPRPIKWRKVCCMPQNNKFGPLNYSGNTENYINMTIDEYESIRLMDIEELTQEECANQMNIARTTVQGIYNNARKKLAQSLVNGKILTIDGGEYRLCDGMGIKCGKIGCHKRICQKTSNTD